MSKHNYFFLFEAQVFIDYNEGNILKNNYPFSTAFTCTYLSSKYICDKLVENLYKKIICECYNY